jgi:hypothetical protein
MAGRGRSWGSGGGIAAASSVLTDLLVRYERYKNNNCRSNTPIPSAQVVSATVYADAAALAAAFPAAANAGKMGKVTSGSSYVFYTSNGSAYTLNTTPTVGYLNPGSATPAGYKVQVMGTGIVNARPANGGAQLLKPVRLYGAFPYLSGSGITKGVVQYLPNAVDASEGTAARGGRYAFVTEDVYPAVFIGGGNALQMTVDDGSGPRRVVDPTLSAIGPGNCAFIQTQSGGIYWTTLDFSQLGGRKRRYVEFPLWGDFGLVSVGISSTATFFDPPNHPLVLHLADSLGGTVSQGASCEAYSEVMRDVLGNPNWWLDSESGTGFLAGNRTHRQKIANLSTFPQLKAVALGIMALSVNDGNGMAVGNFTAAQVTAEVVLTLRAALDAWPGIYWILLGSTASATTVSQTACVAYEQAVIAGIAQVNSPYVLFVPAMTDASGQAVTGTGNSLAPTGVGNADILFTSLPAPNDDLTHFGVKGHFAWGNDRMVPGVVNAVRQLLGQS